MEEIYEIVSRDAQVELSRADEFRNADQAEATGRAPSRPELSLSELSSRLEGVKPRVPFLNGYYPLLILVASVAVLWFVWHLP